MSQKQRIQAQADRQFRAGRGDKAVKLHMLAAELKTVRLGEEIER